MTAVSTQARATFQGVHRAIASGLVRACHDLSEGGLAVAAAEMAFAGGLGLDLDLTAVTEATGLSATAVLFSESNSRFLIEVPAERAAAFEETLSGVPCQRLGEVTEQAQLQVRCAGQTVLEDGLQALKAAWLGPLNW